MVYSSAATLEEDPAPTASVMVSIKIRNSRQSSGGHIDIPTVSSEELLSLWKGIQPAFCLLIATSKCLLELLTVRLSMFRAEKKSRHLRLTCNNLHARNCQIPFLTVVKFPSRPAVEFA